MCIVSLTVVLRLRTSRSPFSRVFSPTITVNSTPISSYLHTAPKTHDWHAVCLQRGRQKCCKNAEGVLTWCAVCPWKTAVCPCIQAMRWFPLLGVHEAGPRTPGKTQMNPIFKKRETIRSREINALLSWCKMSQGCCWRKYVNTFWLIRIKNSHLACKHSLKQD